MSKQAADGAVMVLTTLADDERAEELARMIVNERLAACVHVQGRGVSFYRWKDSVERDAERQLIIKTTRQKVPALRERLATLHPYELPEFLVVSVEEASAEYLGGSGSKRAERAPVPRGCGRSPFRGRLLAADVRPPGSVDGRWLPVAGD